MKHLTQPEAPILASISNRKSYFCESIVRHQEHEINVALSGEGVYQLDGQETLRLGTGEILLLPAGVHHGIEVQQNLRMAVIHLHPSVFDRITVNTPAAVKLLNDLKNGQHSLPSRKIIAPDAYATLTFLTEETMVEINRKSLARESLLQCLAQHAAIHFLRLMLAESNSEIIDESDRRVLCVQAWIDRHFAEPCAIEGLAKKAHLAPTYFAAQFSRLIGVPPMTYVRRQRLEQAKRLLAQTDRPVKAIAWDTGFSTAGHFHHAFRKFTGQTPLAYREEEKSRRNTK